MKNINELSQSEKADLMRQEFEQKSVFEKLFPEQSSVKIPCAEFYQKFRNQIERLLVSKGIVEKINFPLEELHLHIPQELRSYNLNDGVNKISTFFYENDAEFAQIYLDFVKNFLRQKFDFPFYFQAIPTLRLHCPNAENSHHYPRFHTDIGYGHPPQEINLWLNLTKPVGEQKHGFRVMNLEDSMKLYQKYNFDFTPLIKEAVESKEFNVSSSKIAPQVDTKEREIFVMDSRCYHTGEPLLNHTRISMDVRIIPVESYKNLPVIYQGAGRMKILFAPGGCYNQLSSDQL